MMSGLVAEISAGRREAAAGLARSTALHDLLGRSSEPDQATAASPASLIASRGAITCPFRRRDVVGRREGRRRRERGRSPGRRRFGRFGELPDHGRRPRRADSRSRGRRTSVAASESCIGRREAAAGAVGGFDRVGARAGAAAQTTVTSPAASVADVRRDRAVPARRAAALTSTGAEKAPPGGRKAASTTAFRFRRRSPRRRSLRRRRRSRTPPTEALSPSTIGCGEIDFRGREDCPRPAGPRLRRSRRRGRRPSSGSLLVQARTTSPAALTASCAVAGDHPGRQRLDLDRRREGGAARAGGSSSSSTETPGGLAKCHQATTASPAGVIATSGLRGRFGEQRPGR